MSDTQAILVLGAESTGTRLVTRILLYAGCHGSDQGRQPFDREIPVPGRKPIVWRRSMPHAREFVEVGKLVTTLRDKGYRVAAVVTTRDWQAAALSQVAAGHVDNQTQAWRNLQQAYPLIFNALDVHYVPYVMVNYESLVMNSEAVITWLAGRFGLWIPTVEVYDGNAKWLTLQQPS